MESGSENKGQVEMQGKRAEDKTLRARLKLLGDGREKLQGGLRKNLCNLHFPTWIF